MMHGHLELISSADLTPAEMQLVRDYRQLHAEARRIASVIMHQYTTNAGLRKAPTFKVVEGGQS